jgi:hypothetical protein
MCYTSSKLHKKTGTTILISDCFGVGFDWKDEAFQNAVRNHDESLWDILEWMALGDADECNKAESFESNLSYDSKIYDLLENEYLGEFGKNMIEMYLDGSLLEKVKEERSKYGSVKKKSVSGYVYLILAENGLYKIGKAKNVSTRLQPFSVHFPMKWELVYTFQSDDYSKAEAQLHSKFADKRGVGEWFQLESDDVEYIKSIQDGQL